MIMRPPARYSRIKVNFVMGLKALGSGSKGLEELKETLGPRKDVSNINYISSK